ncbi:hypothetical protein [Pseudogemmobacter sonorensis]|uniref:hypothetical protein n=1 Tax=Pseudogemmobacter sonorensis TaxID=2989681 RepID=UPI0036A17479
MEKAPRRCGAFSQWIAKLCAIEEAGCICDGREVIRDAEAVQECADMTPPESYAVKIEERKLRGGFLKDSLRGRPDVWPPIA